MSRLSSRVDGLSHPAPAPCCTFTVSRLPVLSRRQPLPSSPVPEVCSPKRPAPLIVGTAPDPALPVVQSVEDDEQTIRSLLSRLIGPMGMWNAAMATRNYDWSVEEQESRASMRRRLAEEGPTYITAVRSVVADGRLDDTFVDALCEPAEVFTYGGVIAHVPTFAAHRRKLVALTFTRRGLPPMWSADRRCSRSLLPSLHWMPSKASRTPTSRTVATHSGGRSRR